MIVNAKGRAVILDFGLAHHKGKTALTEPGVAMGTAPYMSPEQARGDPVDQRTDLWSLGVVIYEALTGVLPFDSGHHLATLYTIINEDATPIRELRPDIPAELEHIVEKTLAKDPDQRYQTASEILAELGGTAPSFESGPTVTSARPALPVKPNPEPTRRPWTSWAASALAVLALAYAGWTLLPRQDGAPSPRCVGARRPSLLRPGSLPPKPRTETSTPCSTLTTSSSRMSTDCDSIRSMSRCATTDSPTNAEAARPPSDAPITSAS